LMREIERAAKSSSYSIGAQAQEEVLRNIAVAVETRSATLDESRAKLIARVCRDVLLAVRYPPPLPENVGYGRSDGVAHHAAHWITGHFLSGTTCSPEPATIAAQFVAMEEALAAYAEALAEQREAAKAALLKHARRLGKECRRSSERGDAAANGHRARAAARAPATLFSRWPARCVETR
jgi:hypothetical protein